MKRWLTFKINRIHMGLLANSRRLENHLLRRYLIVESLRKVAKLAAPSLGRWSLTKRCTEARVHIQCITTTQKGSHQLSLITVEDQLHLDNLWEQTVIQKWACQINELVLLLVAIQDLSKRGLQEALWQSLQGQATPRAKAQCQGSMTSNRTTMISWTWDASTTSRSRLDT